MHQRLVRNQRQRTPVRSRCAIEDLLDDIRTGIRIDPNAAVCHNPNPTDLLATRIQIAYRFAAVPRGERCLDCCRPFRCSNAPLIPEFAAQIVSGSVSFSARQPAKIDPAFKSRATPRQGLAGSQPEGLA